ENGFGGTNAGSGTVMSQATEAWGPAVAVGRDDGVAGAGGLAAMAGAGAEWSGPPTEPNARSRPTTSPPIRARTTTAATRAATGDPAVAGQPARGRSASKSPNGNVGADGWASRQRAPASRSRRSTSVIRTPRAGDGGGGAHRRGST